MMSTDIKWWQPLLGSDECEANVTLDTLINKLDVKLLAFDFDLTLVDINTGGRWNGSIQELSTHFRPCFKKLIVEALKRDNLIMTVVTFSIQPMIIEELLRYLFPSGNTERFIIEANPERIHPQLNPRTYVLGKENHLSKVINKIRFSSGYKIKPHQIILFDDRILYIQIARNSGHLAYYVNDNISLKGIREYVERMLKNRTKRPHYVVAEEVHLGQPHPVQSIQNNSESFISVVMCRK